jgi:hypothetical protein
MLGFSFLDVWAISHFLAAARALTRAARESIHS